MASSRICEPCNRKQSLSTAVSWCSDCEEALCQECVDAHRVIKVSSDHHVINLEHALSVPDVLTTSQQYCGNHSDLVLDLFCIFHDILCCRACMTESHRTCEKIVPIDLACKGITDSALLVNLNEELSNIVTSSQQISDIRQKQRNNIVEQETRMKQQIGKAKSDVIAYVEKLEQSLLNDLKELSAGQQSELSSQQAAMLSIGKEASDLQRQISYATQNGSKKQIFMLLHKVKMGITEMDQTIEQTIKTMEQPTLQFKQSNSGFTFTEELGNIKIRKDACSVTYKSPKLRFAQFLPDAGSSISTLEFENKFDIDTSPQMQITGMAATEKGNLLLCNYRNNKILAYDSSGTFLSSCHLSGAPWDVAIQTIEQTQAIVTLPQSSSIRFVDVEQMKPGRAVELPGNCYGVVTKDDKILVGGIQDVYVLDCNGIHVSTIKLQRTTRIWYMEFLNDHVLYSDQNKVSCVNLNGDEVFTYDSPGLKRPMGIAVDHRSNVYVSGCNSNNIQRLSANGVFIDTVLGKTDKTNHPWAMCFDHSSGKLVFANNDGKTICVFRCK